MEDPSTIVVYGISSAYHVFLTTLPGGQYMGSYIGCATRARSQGTASVVVMRDSGASTACRASRAISRAIDRARSRASMASRRVGLAVLVGVTKLIHS